MPQAGTGIASGNWEGYEPGMLGGTLSQGGLHLLCQGALLR